MLIVVIRLSSLCRETFIDPLSLLSTDQSMRPCLLGTEDTLFSLGRHFTSCHSCPHHLIPLLPKILPSLDHALSAPCWLLLKLLPSSLLPRPHSLLTIQPLNLPWRVVGCPAWVLRECSGQAYLTLGVKFHRSDLFVYLVLLLSFEMIEGKECRLFSCVFLLLLRSSWHYGRPVVMGKKCFLNVSIKITDTIRGDKNQWQ